MTIDLLLAEFERNFSRETWDRTILSDPDDMNSAFGSLRSLSIELDHYALRLPKKEEQLEK